MLASSYPRLSPSGSFEKSLSCKSLNDISNGSYSMTRTHNLVVDSHPLHQLGFQEKSTLLYYENLKIFQENKAMTALKEETY